MNMRPLFGSNKNLLVVTASVITLTTSLLSSPCYGKPIVEPPSPPEEFSCPPNNVVSSTEELDHYCAYGEWFASKSDETRIGEYVCYDWKGNKLCEGTVNINIEIPPCHQPTISDCSDSNKDEYFSVCAIEDHAIVKGQTNCNIDEGTFACWDIIENRWCQGRIEKREDKSEDETTKETSTTIIDSTTPTLNDQVDETESESTSILESSSMTLFGFVLLGALSVGVIIGFKTSRGRQRASNGHEGTVVEYSELGSAENTV